MGAEAVNVAGFHFHRQFFVWGLIPAFQVVFCGHETLLMYSHVQKVHLEQKSLLLFGTIKQTRGQMEHVHVI